MKKTSKKGARTPKNPIAKHLCKDAASAGPDNSARAVTTPPITPTPPVPATETATSFGGGWTGQLESDETRTSEPSPAFGRATGLLQAIRGPQPAEPGTSGTGARTPSPSTCAAGSGATAPRTTMRVAAIIVPYERRRRADARVVGIIAESVRRRGLLCPIRVRRDGRLVSGLHRLLSHELLRLDGIDVLIVDEDTSELDVELDEVEENLCRRDLSVLERALAESRRKALYLELHQATKRGVAGAVARHDPEGQKPKSPSFAAAEAKPGSGRRMVEQRSRIAEKLGADAPLLLGHPIANNHTKLVQLARVPDGTRQAVVEKLARGEAKTVGEALKPPPSKPKGKAPVPTQFPVLKAADGGLIVLGVVRGRRQRNRDRP